MSEDLSGLSMEELFQMETETQCTALSDSLIGFASASDRKASLEAMMRAAHSIKGAARIVHREDAVRIAHALEEIFMRAQAGTISLDSRAVDVLLAGSDFLLAIGQGRALDAEGVKSLLDSCEKLEAGKALPEPATKQEMAAQAAATAQSLRVDADRLDRILGLAGEGSVAARRLEKLAGADRGLALLATRVADLADRADTELAEAMRELQGQLRARSAALDSFAQAATRQAEMLYEEVIASRMRPFSSSLAPLRRLVHDLARDLGKQVELEVGGGSTPVDREVMEKLESPLTHLVRNSLDHGIESPAQRSAAGKPETGRIRLEARHLAGHLVVTLTDDGRGLDLDSLRERVIERGHTSRETVEAMSGAEVADFILLPGFSSRSEVTELSGRGFGLDVVQTIARSLRGTARILQPEIGFGIELRLPISLSVLRSLIVTIAGEPFAFPLAHVSRVLRIPFGTVESAESRQYFRWEDQLLPLASGAQILGLPGSPPPADSLHVLVLRDNENAHGIFVDAFLNEQDLVIQPLDSHFGKVPGISAASVLEDGSPVLIVDTADFTTAMERLAATGSLQAVEFHESDSGTISRHQILVADDSLTVRELERKLLTAGGYDVTVAVDGMDAWNALRAGRFDLVLTDVDMPRMDGIELTRLIKADARLAHVPVMIVSYKDRPEDHRRGLEAGADYYLTKGAFQDEGLLTAVADLLGVDR